MAKGSKVRPKKFYLHFVSTWNSSVGNTYLYYYRPEYHSERLLIEFIRGVERESFGHDLFDAIKAIHPTISGATDAWMNDEFFLTVVSDCGTFTLSKDIWGLAFIMSKESQDCLALINDLLEKDNRFEKLEVDFAKYRSKGES